VVLHGEKDFFISNKDKCIHSQLVLLPTIMQHFTLNQEDHELIEQARQLIRTRNSERHAVAAALYTSSGKIYLGLHLETYVGRAAVCAESIAIGNAALTGDTGIQTLVAVYRNQEIVSPCGICRELIMDYAPLAKVILQEENRMYKIGIQDLLPQKYRRK